MGPGLLKFRAVLSATWFDPGAAPARARRSRPARIGRRRSAAHCSLGGAPRAAVCTAAACPLSAIGHARGRGCSCS